MEERNELQQLFLFRVRKSLLPKDIQEEDTTVKKIRQTFFYGAIGATSGLAGLTTLSRCSGGNCTSCLGCAGAGLAVLLAALISGLKKKEVKTDGKI